MVRIVTFQQEPAAFIIRANKSSTLRSYCYIESLDAKPEICPYVVGFISSRGFESTKVRYLCVADVCFLKIYKRHKQLLVGDTPVWW
jgi:hypothetical protein